MKRTLKKISHQNGADYIAEIQIGTRVYKGVGATRLEAFKKARAVARSLHGNFEIQKNLARHERKLGVYGRFEEVQNRDIKTASHFRKLRHKLYSGMYSRRPIKNPIDHSILSPSGRVSRATQKRTLERARLELFGKRGLDFPRAKQESDKENMIRRAKELRELSSRGLKPRAYLKEAIRLEALAGRVFKNPIPLAVWEAGVLATPYVIDAGHYGYKKYQEYKKHKKRGRK